MAGNCVILVCVTLLLIAVYDVMGDETCHCRDDDGHEYMKHCGSCCGDRRNQHCCEDDDDDDDDHKHHKRLSGKAIACISIGAGVVLGLAITAGICVYKKKVMPTTKTGPSHLVGPVISLESGTVNNPEKKQPLPQGDVTYGTPEGQKGPLPLAEVPISAPPAYQMLPEPYVPGQADDRFGLMSPPPPYSTPIP